MFSHLLADLRYSLRALAAKPGFSIIAVLTLAIGIGANTAVYSVFRQLVTRSLPVFEPEQLVNLSAPGPKPGTTSNSGIGPRDAIFSYPMARDLQAQQSVFTGLAAHRNLTINLAFRGQTQTGQALMVSPEYFTVLGLRPALGSLFDTADDRAIGEPRIAVLSHAYWVNRLGSAADVLNQTVKVNGQSLTIVGVAPAGFDGTTIGTRAQVFVPLALRWILTPDLPPDHDNRQSYWVYLFARLQPGIGPEQAAQSINQLYSHLISDVELPLQKGLDAITAAQFAAKQIVLEPGARGQSSLSRNAATPMSILLAVAGLVLLVACLNTANLLLARGTARAGEIAIRASLGASRTQLVRQQLLESAVLAALGALASLPLALLAMRILIAAMPPEPAAAVDINLDGAALRFAMLAALATVLVFGLFPAIHAARTASMATLKSAANPFSAGRLASRFRSVLATVQIALSLSSLVLAGLFIQSLNNVSRVNLGMSVESLATFSISPPRNGYDEVRTAQLYDRVEEQLAAIPGVNAVASSMVPLLSGNNWGTNVSVEGYSSRNPDDAQALFNRVGSGYFSTLDVPLLLGRDFSAADSKDRPSVAIVNRRFAEVFGLGQDVVGKRMALGGTDELSIEIVGLAENSRYDNVKVEAPPQFFLPRRQSTAVDTLTYYVRSELPPEQLLQSLSSVVAAIDAELPVEDLQTMPQQIRKTLSMDRFVSLLSAVFALLATLLAAGGVYGLLSYTIAQRTRDIGLRLALGAAPARVQAALFAQVGRMLLVGGSIGLLVAVALGRKAQSLLYQLDGHDPTVLLASCALLLLVAVLAAWWPARRAARISPLVALRWE